MSTKQPKLVRVASMIQDDLVRKATRFQTLMLPLPAWNRLIRLTQGFQFAQSRGWLHAARQRNSQLSQEIEELEDALKYLAKQVLESVSTPSTPSLADIYYDLVALDSEFEQLECDPDQQLIAVTTERIVLEGIDLGRFQIRLNWCSPAGAQAYRIVALDPNPAASNENTTHPHISDESLCEGSGRPAIQASLIEGRLYDFFTIVRQLLRTYAHGRAYVELDQWYGLPCCDCGGNVCENERYCCNHCGQNLCADCILLCRQCDAIYCSGCTSSCEQCDRTICRSCLERCRMCGSQVCGDCLTQKLCNQCDETQSNNDESENGFIETQRSTAALPEIHSDSLGQIGFSA